MRVFTLLSVCGILAGCATVPFGNPGDTVDVSSASSGHVTFWYTHHYASELPFTSQRAELHCRAYGRNAQLIQMSQVTMDRSQVTYICAD